MKQNLFCKLLKYACISLAIIIFFVNCNDEAILNTDCNGYTGDVTNENAKKLVAICHFMPKDSIDSWTDRYQKNKLSIGTAMLPTIPNILGDSCSFNNTIVRAIITNDSCIGLRIINGMDVNKKVHAILVGVKPDYTTLYIKRPKDCAVKNVLNKDAGVNDGDPDDDFGGGEMALEP